MEFERDNHILIKYHEQEGIHKVIVPKDITIIKEYAFKDCSTITDIELPDGLEEINDGAFLGCTSLKTLSIPESVTFISRALPTMIPIHIKKNNKDITIILKDKPYIFEDYSKGRDNDYFTTMIYEDNVEVIEELLGLMKDMDYRIPAALMMADAYSDHEAFISFIKRNPTRTFRYLIDTHDDMRLKTYLELIKPNTSNLIRYANKQGNTSVIPLLENY